MLSVCVCMDQLQPYVYCVYLYCPVSAMYLYLTTDVSMSSDQDAETAAALRPRHGRLLRPPAHSRQEVRQHPRGESQHYHNVTFILEFLNSTLCSEAGCGWWCWSPLPHVAPGAPVRAQGDPRPQQAERGQGAGAALGLLQPGWGAALAAAADGARSADSYCL